MTAVVRMQVVQVMPVGADLKRVTLSHIPDQATDFHGQTQGDMIVNIRNDSQIAPLFSIGGSFHITMVEEKPVDAEHDPVESGPTESKPTDPSLVSEEELPDHSEQEVGASANPDLPQENVD